MTLQHVYRSGAAWLLALTLAIGGLTLPEPPSSHAITLRLKDISHIKGVRNNQLVGYGLVVGLKGTGDKSRSTINATWNLLQNMGARFAAEGDIKPANTAAVMVTASVPPFAKPGDPLDVTISSMADCKSLEGGVLISTQLMAPNGEVVAVAQGPVAVGGVSVSSGGSSVRTAITTSGRIPNGGIIEREIVTELGDDSGVEVVLNNRTDFTLASRVADVVSQRLAPARAVDGSTIRVSLPLNYQDNRVAFLAQLENLNVDSTQEVAKIVVNERTGTIVIGNNVRLLPAAVAHGGITVTVTTTNSVSQPNALASGQTTGVSNSNINVEQKSGSLVQLSANASLRDLVSALNAIGVKPTDLISILQALKAAGSLEATLEII